MAASATHNTADFIFLCGNEIVKAVQVSVDGPLTLNSNDYNTADFNAISKYYKSQNLKTDNTIKRVETRKNITTNNYLGDQISSDNITNLLTLKLAFFKEFRNQKSLTESNFKKLISSFEFLSKKLYVLPFEKCAIEIISQSDIKFSIVFKDEKILMVKTLSDEIEDHQSHHNIIYTYFIKRNFISSDIADIDVFIKKFHNYISA